MLNPDTLEKQLYNAFSQYLPVAFEEAIKSVYPEDSEVGNDMAKDFGQTVSDLLSESLASSIAAAIDYYVKNISITGTINTVGTPAAQTAVIVAATPLTAGVVPNTLKVS